MGYLATRFLQQLASSSPWGQCGVKSHTLLSSMQSPLPQSNNEGGQTGGGGTLLSVTGIKNERLIQSIMSHVSPDTKSYQVIISLKNKNKKNNIDELSYGMRSVSTLVVL